MAQPTYRRRRGRLVTTSVDTRAGRLGKVVIYSIIGLLAAAFAFIMVNNYRMKRLAEETLEVRQTEAAAADRAKLFADLRAALDLSPAPPDAYEREAAETEEFDEDDFGWWLTDLRSPDAAPLYGSDPSIRSRIADLEIIGPGELFLMRTPFGAGVIYRISGEDVAEIEGQLAFLGRVGYTDQEIQESLDVMIKDGRLAFWAFASPVRAPAPAPASTAS